MKNLVLLVLLYTGVVHAGTVYQDRPIPFPLTDSTPCMVRHPGGVYYNVNMMSTIGIGEHSYPKLISGAAWIAKYETVTERATITTLVTGVRFVVTGTEADLMKSLNTQLADIAKCRVR